MFADPAVDDVDHRLLLKQSVCLVFMFQPLGELLRFASSPSRQEFYELLLVVCRRSAAV